LGLEAHGLLRESRVLILYFQQSLLQGAERLVVRPELQEMVVLGVEVVRADLVQGVETKVDILRQKVTTAALVLRAMRQVEAVVLEV
jgi:hypothetical protein